MGGDRSTKLVPPTLGSMIDRQSGDQVGYVGPLHRQTGIQHPILVQTGKVQECGIQQDVQIAKAVHHALQDQLQHSFPSGTSTRSSLPSFSRKSSQLGVRLTLRRKNPQEMCRFPQSLEMAIHETFIRLDQCLEPAGRLERDRAYGLVINVPWLLIVKLVDLG